MYYRFRFLNALSVCLSFLTEGRVFLRNPFQTEELESLYRRTWKAQLVECIQQTDIQKLLLEKKLTLDYFTRRKMIEHYIDEKYNLIGICSLVM